MAKVGPAEICPTAPPRSGLPTHGVGTVWLWIHGPVGTESRKGVSASTIRESPDARRDWIGGGKPRILLCIVRTEGKTSAQSSYFDDK